MKEHPCHGRQQPWLCPRQYVDQEKPDTYCKVPSCFKVGKVDLWLWWQRTFLKWPQMRMRQGLPARNCRGGGIWGAGKRVVTRRIIGPKLIKLCFKWAVYYISILSWWWFHFFTEVKSHCPENFPITPFTQHKVQVPILAIKVLHSLHHPSLPPKHMLLLFHPMWPPHVPKQPSCHLRAFVPAEPSGMLASRSHVFLPLLGSLFKF